MRIVTVFLSLLIIFFASVQLQIIGDTTANPSIPPEIPPIVSVARMNYNASISSFNNQQWAKVDIEYVTETVYAFGDSYLLPKEFAAPADPSPYIKYTVVTDKLDADYPMPLDATNITVKVNNQETQWQMKDRSNYHLYGSNMPRIGWTIQPVQHGFTLNVHYEHPLLKTSDEEYALLIPLGQRYSSTGAPAYPLYDWFGQGTPVASINIQTEQGAQIKAYSINNRGTLSLIDYSNSNSVSTATMEIKKEQNTAFPFGAVVLIHANPSTLQPSSVPEFSLLTILPLLMSAFAIAVVVLSQKNKRRKVKPE
jgi:hypothetical protein